MKKKIKIILAIIIVLCILIFVGLYYLNTYYLPQKVKIEITQTLSEKLNATVQLEDIKFSLLKGIVLNNLSITSKKEPTPILKIERLSASFLILPSIKQRKIIFPSINILNASVNIVRNKQNQLNILDYFPRKESSQDSWGHLPFLIYKINLSDSQIIFTDKTMQPDIKFTLKIDNLKAQPSLLDVNFQLKATLIDNKQSTGLETWGSFQFKSKELNIASHIKELDILPYIAYFKDLPVSIESLNLADINIESSLLKDKLFVKTQTEITDAYFKKEAILISQGRAKIKATVDIDLKDTANINYLIDIDSLNANLTASQIPDTAEIEYAKLKVSLDGLEIENAKINIAKIPIAIRGNLKNFSNPTFNFNLESDFDFALSKQLAGNYFDFLNSLTAQGNASLKLNILKSKDKKELDFKGVLGLKDALIKTNDMPYSISAINGLINFDRNNINWSQLSLRLLENNFQSQATISNLKSPSINLELNSDKINIKAVIESVQKNLFNIEQLRGNYFDSDINLTGTLDIQAPHNYNAVLDIESRIELANLKQIPYLSKDIILKVNPQGLCRITGKIRGNVKNPKTLNSALELNSDELQFYGIKIENVQIQLSQENQQIKIPQSSTKFYAGSILSNGLIDLEKKDFPYAFKIISSDIDLSLLKLDTPLKDKTLYGIFNSTLILTGALNSLEDVKGQGNFLIKDGYLWEFNPLKKLGDFLFIPRYRTLIFKQAQADLNIHDKKISTDNLVLNSDIISLSCEGDIDFKGNLDFEIIPKPIVEVPQDSDNAKLKSIFTEEFFKLAGISIVKLTGTVQEPKIETRLLLKDVVDTVIKGTTGKLKDEVIDTLKDIKDLIFGGQE